MTSSIVVAGGKGLRMKNDIRKQYLHLNGVPVLARTLTVFNDCPAISQILLVIPGEDLDFVKKEILTFFDPKKEIRLVPGGKRRQNSVYNGLTEISDQNALVVIHDGVRPFVSLDDIANCIDAAKKFGAGILGIPALDTLKQVNSENYVVKTLERKTIWHAQTPQAFQFRLIRDAHEAAIKKGLAGTDDAALVEEMGRCVKMVMGNKHNIKITTPEDLKFAEAILQLAVNLV